MSFFGEETRPAIGNGEMDVEPVEIAPGKVLEKLSEGNVQALGESVDKLQGQDTGWGTSEEYARLAVMSEPSFVDADDQAIEKGFSEDQEGGSAKVQCDCRSLLGPMLALPSKDLLQTKFVFAIDLAYPEVDNGRVFSAAPVARCSNVGRFHKNKGTGAYKYEPVSCTEILQPTVCDALRQARGSGEITFQFEVLLLPEAGIDLVRKVLTVPSTGCPRLLTDATFCKNLLWAAHAKTRPTFLVVHASEANFYLEHAGDAMRACNVGIVSWTCKQGVLGFGASRLAAQCIGGMLGKRGDVVAMADHNVMNAHKLEDGYATDKEETVRSSVKSSGLYVASGGGAGTPRVTWAEGNLKTVSKDGGDTRPLEQVVMVGAQSRYDPCFITSSEDADMTQRFLKEENQERQSQRKASAMTFRGRRDIDKIGLDDPLTSSYMIARDNYLETLYWEDHVKIIYKSGGEDRTVTIGTLAAEFGDAYGIPAARIRSLIIDKILLQHKDGL